MKRAVGSLLLVCLCVGFVYAGCGRVRTCHSRHHERHDHYEGGHYAYEVGTEYQSQAFAQMVAQELYKLQQQGQPAQQAEYERPPEGSLGELVTQHCSNCHSNAQRPLDVVSCEGRMKILQRVMRDMDDPKHMPKGIELSPEVLGNLVGEVIGIK